MTLDDAPKTKGNARALARVDVESTPSLGDAGDRADRDNVIAIIARSSTGHPGKTSATRT